MVLTDKEIRKLRLGLTFKRLMGKEPKSQANKLLSNKRELSFRELESNSGIRHATIVEIVNAKKNAAWTTVAALLEGLNIKVNEFGYVYDSITEKEILNYKNQLEEKKRGVKPKNNK
jgi:hypothetical protein